MSTMSTPEAWEWTEQRDKAAFHIAEDALSDSRIASLVGVGTVTLWRWRQVPEFAAKVSELRAQIRKDIYTIGVADKRNRLRRLDDLARKLEGIIHDRALRAEVDAAAGKDIPPDEALTGLLVKRKRTVGSGDAQQIVTEWSVDTALLRELRETLKSAAIEMGEWDEAPSLGTENGRGKIFGAAIVQVIKREVIRESPPDEIK